MQHGASHHIRKPDHIVLVLKGDRVHHTYKVNELWTLANVESLNEEPPF